MNISQQARDTSLEVIVSSIRRCEKIQPKFAQKTAQATLLTHRLQALYIAKALLQQEDIRTAYSNEELKDALPPLSSMFSKCKKAQEKHAEGSNYYRRFQTMITAFALAKDLVSEELASRM